jgi:acyl dehydratase
MITLHQTYQLSFRYTQEQVQAFADVTGDHNPIHLDAEYAGKTAFKKPIMHGFLSGSVFSKVFGTLFPGEGTIYLRQTMEFLRPMYVETDYDAVFTVKEINAEKHRALVETVIYDKNTQKPCLRGEAEVMNDKQI